MNWTKSLLVAVLGGLIVAAVAPLFDHLYEWIFSAPSEEVRENSFLFLLNHPQAISRLIYTLNGVAFFVIYGFIYPKGFDWRIAGAAATISLCFFTGGYTILSFTVFDGFEIVTGWKDISTIGIALWIVFSMIPFTTFNIPEELGYIRNAKV